MGMMLVKHVVISGTPGDGLAYRDLNRCCRDLVWMLFRLHIISYDAEFLWGCHQDAFVEDALSKMAEGVWNK